MPQSMTLACPPRWTLDTFAPVVAEVCLLHDGELRRTERGLQATAWADHWRFVLEPPHRHPDAYAEYSTTEWLDPRFRVEVRDLVFVTIVFAGAIDSLRDLVRLFADDVVRHDETAWVDTDYGWVIHAADFLARTANGAPWDWRYDPDAP